MTYSRFMSISTWLASLAFANHWKRAGNYYLVGVVGALHLGERAAASA